MDNQHFEPKHFVPVLFAEFLLVLKTFLLVLRENFLWIAGWSWTPHRNNDKARENGKWTEILSSERIVLISVRRPDILTDNEDVAEHLFD